MQDQIKEQTKFFIYKDSKCYGRIQDVEIDKDTIYFTADTVDDFEEVSEIDLFGELKLVEEGRLLRNIVKELSFYVTSFNLSYAQGTNLLHARLTLKDPLE